MKLELENLGSLITIKGKNQCLGDLMHFDGKGTYDSKYGRVEVTKEQAEIHNAALDKALLEGLDKNCRVGQGSYAYYNPKKGNVQTFIGTVISDHVKLTGKTLRFERNGMFFRGRLRDDSDVFNYVRTK